MNLKKLFFALLCLSFIPLAGGEESPVERNARMAWWKEARFGMFIHWGPVALKGTEISWSRANSNPKCPNKGKIPVEVYDNLYKEFNPVKFNAAEWVGLAKEAGMKYVVLTAKHCDGFLLWHSKVSDYNIASTPFKRDVCAELSEAVRKQGLKLGWYFSPMDWRDPDFRTERNSDFIKRMQGEIRELLTSYGKVDMFWIDYDGREPMYDQATTYPLIKQLQPNILLTNRLDLGVGNNNRQILSPYADYYTPEQSIGNYDDQRPWETCMTLGKQWSWKPDDKIKSSGEVINILVKCVGGDGNLLLNVGPMPDGRIEPRQVNVLKEVGIWIAKYGESIYGTRGGPYKPGKSYVSTRKDNTIYLHILKCPEGGLQLPPLAAKITSSKLLTGGEVIVKQTPEGVTIDVPAGNRQEIDTLVKLEIDKPAMDIEPIAPVGAEVPAKPEPKKPAPTPKPSPTP